MTGRLNLELRKLKKWIKAKRQGIVLILEGQDNTYRSLLAQQLEQHLGKELFRRVAKEDITARNTTETSRQLLGLLPLNGGLVVFDGCWLRNTDRAAEIPQEILQDLENFLHRSGHTLVKIWFRADIPVNAPPYLDIQSTKVNTPHLHWQIIAGEENENLLEICLNQIPYQDLTFSDQSVNLPALRQRAYNLRWATVDPGLIPLTAADPDFPVAVEIEEAIKSYTTERVFSYGPPEGLLSFRETVANTLQDRKQIPTTPDLVLPVDGAASGMFTIARFALQAGDEALIFDPVDFLFQKSVEAAGGKVVRVPMNTQTGTFDPDEMASLITKRTRMIGVCNPHNPLGRVLRREELEFIGQLAIEHDLWIMNDEVWSDIVYPPFKHTSMAALDEAIAQRTISVFGFSKTFGLAGLRVGHILAPNKKVYSALVEASKVTTTAAGVTTLSQIAATAAYRDCWYWADAFIEHLAGIRNYAVKRLNQMPGVEANSPEGTYVLFANITGTGKESQEMAAYLLKEAKVSVVPGLPQWFGPRAAGHIRLCFSTSKGIITEALDRIEHAIDRI
jgi:aminotransferase